MLLSARRNNVIAAVLCAVVAALSAGRALAAPPLWVVKSPTATIYLFGTMHILQADADWRSPALESAYANADVIWFETDVSAVLDKNSAKALILRYGLDPDHTLSSELTPTELGRLQDVLAPYHASLYSFQHFHPWVVSLVIQALPQAKAGFKPGLGADAELNASAVADHKTVRTFETVDQQIQMLAGLPADTQMQMLDSALEERSRTAAITRAMEKLWLSGQLDKFGPLLIKQMKARYPALYEVILQRRNEAWAKVLTDELAGSRTEMVNVGALHMVGSDGLPALLAARGFTVERVQ